MALIDRFYRIPSKRRLCEEVASTWLIAFLQLSLYNNKLHHSTIIKNGHGRSCNVGIFALVAGDQLLF